MLKLNKFVAAIIASIIVFLSYNFALAANSNGLFSQTYSASSSVLPGMIVRLKGNQVVPLTANQVSNMLGVVISPNQATAVLSQGSSSSQQVLVASGGQYDLLVDTQNGPIKPGDYLSVSSFAGIAMAASSSDNKVVGQAKVGFDGSESSVGSQTIKSANGKSQTVEIGLIPAIINLGDNPLAQNSSLPLFITKLARSITNKPVSSARIYLSAALLLITVFISSSVIYSGVKGSMVAIGRNPLSKKYIFRELLKVILICLIIVIVGLAISFLILSA